MLVLRRAAAMAAVLSVIALIAAPTSARAQGLSLKFDIQDDARLSDTVSIVARVTGVPDEGIDKVEFSIDGALKATDTSIPYTLEWDTLADTEGPHTVLAVATDGAGRTAQASVRVAVDNELTKGAEALATVALEALKGGDKALAERYSRRALRADPRNLHAARAMAGLLREQGEIAKAIDVLEAARIPDSDTAVRADLVALHLLMADLADSTTEFIAQATLAAQEYRKLVAARTASAGSDPVKQGDAHFEARNWPEAVKAYQQAGDPTTGQMEAVNRLLLAYVMAHRAKDAEKLIKTLSRSKRADDVTQAVIGAFAISNGQPAKCLAAVKSGIASRSLPALLVGAVANLSLDKRTEAGGLTDQASAIAPNLPTVALLQAHLVRDAIEQRKAIIRAMGADPTSPEPFVLRAYLLMLSAEKDRWSKAEQFLRFALTQDPQNTYTLMASACALMAQNRKEEAQPILEQMAILEPLSADVMVAQALNCSLLDRTREITGLLDGARKLDDDRWNYVYVPKPLELLQDMFVRRYSPGLTPACLYPAK